MTLLSYSAERESKNKSSGKKKVESNLGERAAGSGTGTGSGTKSGAMIRQMRIIAPPTQGRWWQGKDTGI